MEETIRVALISGGARGIGRVIALSLAERRWSVAVCYRTSAKDGDETLQAIQQGADAVWRLRRMFRILRWQRVWFGRSKMNGDALML